MYLKEFVIKNFRVFGEDGIHLMFNGGVNAIIGENNSGKSAIIDAIRIAYSTMNYKKDIFFSKSDFHMNDNGKVADFSQFDIYLDDVPKRLIEIWNPESEGATGGEFHVRFEKAINPNGIEKIKVISWGFGNEGNQLTSNTFEAVELVFLGALRDSENEMKPAKNSRLAQLLKNLVPEESGRNELVNVLSEANNELLKKEQLKKTRDTINQNLTQIEQEFLNQQIDIGLVEPRFESIASSLRAWVKPKWVLIEKDDELYDKAQQFSQDNPKAKKVHDTETGIFFESSIINDDLDIDQDIIERLIMVSNRSFELYQNGLGYNNLLFMSAVLGDMSIRKDGIFHNLLLIEEPEAHLHPQLQQLVHKFLSVTNKKDSQIQVIYTSHSPTLASKVKLTNVNLIYEYNHKKYCLPFSRTNLTQSDIFYMQKYLDVTKSQMFFARGIVFVEGISEAILLPEVAKYMQRPFEKYAVELVNVDSVAFTPFVNLLSSDSAKTCFSKVAIITDDDRCSKKGAVDYIDKNLDYDDVCEEISQKIVNGKPSERCEELKKECMNIGMNVYVAPKTLEFALCCTDDNICFMIEAIKTVYKDLGKNLENKIKDLNDINQKATCIWLFIRTRDKCKGAVAQYISQVIKEQRIKEENGEELDKKFTIPDYLKNAIYSVTEK